MLKFSTPIMRRHQPLPVLVYLYLGLLGLGMLQSAQAADVNGDGQIDVQDVNLIRDQLYPNEPDGTCPACDTNGDGRITVRDMLWVMDRIRVQDAPPPSDDTFTLQVLHSSDNESSFQDPNTLETKILNYSEVVVGLQTLAQAEGIPSIHVTAGDHIIPNPFYQASAEIASLGAHGIGDIVIFNAMGLVANGIGNHEFDGGINDFARMLARAEYPFLAVNLDFSQVQLDEGTPAIEIGQDGANVSELAGKIARSGYVEIDGERVGLIGRAPADFFNVIANPSETLPGLDFVGGRNPADNQPLVSAVDLVLEQVDLLEGMGINKIILLDHAQDYTGDPLSATRLRGIDIIVAAGSTGFMAQPTPNGPFNLLRPGNTPSADYPTVRTDSEGQALLVVNSDQIYTYVGNLIVTFDAAGHIVEVDTRSGPVATTEAAIAALTTLVGETAPHPVVADTFAQLQATDLIQEQFEQIGTTTTELNGHRACPSGTDDDLAAVIAPLSARVKPTWPVWPAIPRSGMPTMRSQDAKSTSL